MDCSIVYITAPSVEEAEKIGEIIVMERLCACVNMLSGMKSIYWWQGKMHRAEEVVIIAKTKSGLVGDLMNRIKELHGYECPAIVSWPLKDGNPDFFSWINTETR